MCIPLQCQVLDMGGCHPQINFVSSQVIQKLRTSKGWALSIIQAKAPRPPISDWRGFSAIDIAFFIRKSLLIMYVYLYSKFILCTDAFTCMVGILWCLAVLVDVSLRVHCHSSVSIPVEISSCCAIFTKYF